MPNWTNHPPADARGVSLPLRRTPSTGVWAGIITSPNLIGCNTHYYGGRTQPCEAPTCDACLHGVPYRWHAYLGALEARYGTHLILELTSQATDNLYAYLRAHGTLRGCLLECTRVGPRRNGRVVTRCRPADLNGRTLPPPPDLVAALSIIWGLPRDAAHAARGQGGPTTVDVDPALADLTRRPTPPHLQPNP